LNDRPQYNFFIKSENERALDNVFRGQIHITLERFYFQAGGRVLNVRQRLSPELNVYFRQKENSLNGTMLWQTSKKVSLGLLYESTQFDFGDAEFEGRRLADSFNRKETFFDFITYLQPSPRVQFFLDSQYGEYSFAEASSKYKDARSAGIFGGMSFPPRADRARATAPLQGGISLGYKWFDIIDPVHTDGSGLVGAVDVSVGLPMRMIGRAVFSRNYQFSFSQGGTFYILAAYGAGIGRDLSRRITLSYDFMFSQGTYPEDPGGVIAPGQNFQYRMHIFNLNYRLARNLAISLFGIVGKRYLGESEQVLSHSFFGLNLVYGSPPVTIAAPARGLAQ
jgi:hypothetical protein